MVVRRRSPRTKWSREMRPVKLTSLRSKRADAAVAVDDLLRGDRNAGEDVGERLQDVGDFLVLAADPARTLDADVGRAEQHPPEIGEEDADPAVDVLEVDHVAAQSAQKLGMVQDQVRALGAADQRLRGNAAFGQSCVGLVDPGAGGVEDDVRGHGQRGSGQRVGQQDAPYFARTKRGEILSRFSIDLAAFEGSIKTFANSAALPFLELIAGIILMLFLNWQLAAVALLVFPITLIGPLILTPKAVQANYEQKLNGFALLGTVQENVAAQAVVKAFSLQRRTLGWFTMRNQEVRIKTASAVFLSTMVERTVTISVLLLHLVVLAIGAYLATKGQITIGTFVTFESAFWEVSYNIAHLMHFIPVSIQSAAAVRHIQELLDEPTRGADRPGAPDLPPITNDITFDRVTFAYEGSATPVLDNFSLKLGVGKRIAIVGPERLGQEHAAQPDPASLHAGRGAGGDRRRRYPPRDPRIPAQRHGGRVPGEHAVQHVDPGEHPARQGRRQRRGGRAGRAQGRDLQLHHEPAAEIRHAGRRARRHAVGRPAPAHRDRARGHPQSLAAAAR